MAFPKLSQMNDRQRVVTATFTVALFVIAFFFIPWQRYETGRVMWAPFYRNPITLESTLGGSGVVNRFAYIKGRPMYGLYVLQLVGIAALGAVLFRWAGAHGETDEAVPWQGSEPVKPGAEGNGGL